MEGVLLVASGMLLWRPIVHSAASATALRIGTIAALVVASALRFNAFFACVPLALAALPQRWTGTRRWLLLSAAAAAGLFLAHRARDRRASSCRRHGRPALAHDLRPWRNHRAFGREHVPRHEGPRSRRGQSPLLRSARVGQLFRLGEQALSTGLRSLPGPDRQRRCGCRPFVGPGNGFAPALLPRAPAGLFNLSTCFLAPSGLAFTAWLQSVANPWGFQVRQTGLLSAIGAVTDAAAATPIGWPVFWISLALAMSIAGLIARVPSEPLAIAVSAFLYGAGYAGVGFATGIRYYAWTFSGAAVAALLIGAVLWRRRPELAPIAYWLPALLVAVPTLLGGERELPRREPKFMTPPLRSKLSMSDGRSPDLPRPVRPPSEEVRDRGRFVHSSQPLERRRLVRDDPGGPGLSLRCPSLSSMELPARRRKPCWQGRPRG